MSGPSCSDIGALTAELALGILSGSERADALHHLSRCPSCQQRVEALALVADELLLAGPEREPPIGFDGRVLARLAAERPTGRGRPGPPRRAGPTATPAVGWRRPLAAAAAAVLLAGAALGGMELGRRGAGAGPRPGPATIVSVGTGAWTCHVAAIAGRAGHPTELVVRVDEPADANGWYLVQADPASGAEPVVVGTITVVNGRGALDTAVPAGTGKVRAIQVVAPGGALHYRASFPAL